MIYIIINAAFVYALYLVFGKGIIYLVAAAVALQLVIMLCCFIYTSIEERKERKKNKND